MGGDEEESDDEKDDVGGVLGCKDHEYLDKKKGHGECEYLDEDHDPTVLYHRPAYEFMIERCCLLVIYGELHEQEVAYACRECHVGEEHEQTCLSHDDHRYHEDEREQEDGAVEIELGCEQLLDGMVSHHQTLDIVALVCHDAQQHHGSVD